MSLDSRYDAEVFFKHYKERLSRVVLKGFNDCWNDIGSFAHRLDPQHIPIFIRDFIFNCAQDEFCNDKDIRFGNLRGLDFINLHNEYFLRIKKFKNNLSSSNPRTAQALEYCRGELEFPDIQTRALLLDVGYISDITMRRIKGIYIVKQSENIPFWYLRLDEDDIEAGIPTNLFRSQTPDEPLQIKVKDALIKRKDVVNG